MCRNVVGIINSRYEDSVLVFAWWEWKLWNISVGILGKQLLWLIHGSEVRGNKNSVEQSSSWEANRSSATQEIPCILWNTKVHYRVYDRLPPAPNLSQIDANQAPIPLLYPPIYDWVFQAASFRQVFPLRLYMQLSSPTFMLYSLHISLFLILERS